MSYKNVPFEQMVEEFNKLGFYTNIDFALYKQRGQYCLYLGDEMMYYRNDPKFRLDYEFMSPLEIFIARQLQAVSMVHECDIYDTNAISIFACQHHFEEIELAEFDDIQVIYMYLYYYHMTTNNIVTFRLEIDQMF